MKTIICGPPHSGKSVLIANLEKMLPSDRFKTIRVHRDGEGAWSNNPNQEEVQNVRIKASYDYTFIRAKCDEISRSEQAIVLIDIGGRLQDDKIPIFKMADSFIVISRDADLKMAWKAFGEAQGIKCLALLDSSLDGSEAIYSEKNYLSARVVNLERGTFIEHSAVLRKLSGILLKHAESGINRMISDSVFDFNEIAKDIGCATISYSDSGEELVNVSFLPEKASELFQYIYSQSINGEECKLYGARANWVSAIAVLCLRQRGVKHVSVYDTGYAEYVKIQAKEMVAEASNDLFDFHVDESDESVFLDVVLKKAILTIDDFYHSSIPLINENKMLYVSGKMPIWLFDAIVVSYGNQEQYLFQPGLGFICCRSVNVSQLGTIKLEPDGIDVNEYFKSRSSKK